MLVMNDACFRDQLALERAFGVDRAFNKRKTPGLYDVTMLGFNYRMAELPAAIGVEQLKKIELFENQRKQNFATLKSCFQGIDGVTIKGGEMSDDRSYYCLILQLEGCTVVERNKMINALKEEGVQTSIYYPHPLPRLKFYSDTYGYNPQLYPIAATFADECIAFPVAPHLNQVDMLKISKTFKELL